MLSPKSLISFGARAAARNRGIGGATSRLFNGGNLSAFQTISLPADPSSGRDGEQNKRSYATSSVLGQRKVMASPISNYATNTQPLLFAASIKFPFHPQPNQDLAQTLAQSTRSMAGKAGNEEHFRNGKPTLAYAKLLPKSYSSMTNDQVLHFAELGVMEACRECIVRDIMVVDQVEYDEVCCEVYII